jgi:addiction module RelB/DinJ family antitoxin
MTTNLQVRIDAELRREAEDVFQEMGLDATTAVRMFYHRVVATRSIPFELKADRAEREAARQNFETLIIEGLKSPSSPLEQDWADQAIQKLKERQRAKNTKTKRSKKT